MATGTLVHVRVDEKTKAGATRVLASMGLSVSDAVCVFLARVAAEKRPPFELKVPKSETRGDIDCWAKSRQARRQARCAAGEEK